MAKDGPVWNKDPFLRIKRDVGVPTVQLRQAEAEDEEEEEEEEEENIPTISVAKLHASRKKTSKLDLKGKLSPCPQESRKRSLCPKSMNSHEKEKIPCRCYGCCQEGKCTFRINSYLNAFNCSSSFLIKLVKVSL